MIQIIDKKECTGCTACYSACPAGCIRMVPDEEGFLYPSVDTDKCIECGKCVRTCPVHRQKGKTDFPEGYVCRAKNLETVASSSSGGVFTPIARSAINKGGTVFGVVFDEEDSRIRHKAALDLEGIGRFRGSKYVQSFLGDTFSEVKKALKEDRWVVFSGTPCQVEGLKAYLGREHEKLLTVDVVCHGTPSPKLWKKYVDHQEKKHASKLKKVNFRAKAYGYHSGAIELEFEDGKRYRGSVRTDYMLKSFFKEIASRPSCYACPFKSASHVSDLTLFDAWHAGELVKGLKDDDKGYTNVLVHSQKGKELLLEIRGEIEAYTADAGQMIAMDGVMVCRSAAPHPKRTEFFRSMDRMPMEGLIRTYLPISFADKLIEGSKSWIYRLGLIKAARYCKRRIKSKQAKGA